MFFYIPQGKKGLVERCGEKDWRPLPRCSCLECYARGGDLDAAVRAAKDG